MAAALPIVGAGISAFGALQQGKMTSDSLNNQANNLQAQSDEAEQKGKFDAMREQMIATQRIGTSEAAYGASGVSANSGSVIDVIQASHQNAELDRLNILHGADIRALNYQNQAAMDRYAAKSAIQGSQWQALGAITGGAIKVAGNSQSAQLPKNGSNEGAGLVGGAGSEAGDYAGPDSAEGAGLEYA